MVGRVRQIARGTTTPLIADGDTGYGGLLNVDFTVRGYEEAGAQAIHDAIAFAQGCVLRHPPD